VAFRSAAVGVDAGLHGASWLHQAVEIKGFPDSVKGLPLSAVLDLIWPPTPVERPHGKVRQGVDAEAHTSSTSTFITPFHLDGDRLRELPQLQGLVRLVAYSSFQTIAVQRTSSESYRALLLRRSEGYVHVEQWLDGLMDVRPECMTLGAIGKLYAASADGRRAIEYDRLRPNSVREQPLPQGTTEVLQMGSNGLRPFFLLRDRGSQSALFEIRDRKVGLQKVSLPVGMDPNSIRLESVVLGYLNYALLIHGRVDGQAFLYKIGAFDKELRRF